MVIFIDFELLDLLDVAIMHFFEVVVDLLHVIKEGDLVLLECLGSSFCVVVNELLDLGLLGIDSFSDVFDYLAAQLGLEINGAHILRLHLLICVLLLLVHLGLIHFVDFLELVFTVLSEDVLLRLPLRRVQRKDTSIVGLGRRGQQVLILLGMDRDVGLILFTVELRLSF